MANNYDTDEIVGFAVKAGMETVIPPKRNRKEPREYDRYLYKLRHLVENAFLHLKRWRGIVLHATLRTLHLSLLLFKSAASHFGVTFWLDSCRHYLKNFTYRFIRDVHF